MNRFDIVIIGRPNVGKSSLFNRIVGRRKVIVHDVAGTTRDLITEEVEVNGKLFCLTDTAGYFTEKNNLLLDESLKKVHSAIRDADLLLVVVDGNVLPTREDDKIIEAARKSQKNIILIINKIDNTKKINNVELYKKYGLDVFVTSVIHNKGVNELLEEITKAAPLGSKSTSKDTIKVSIIGRPNVGKSSILNSIAKTERAIVSEVPGTTRDIVTEIINYHNKSYILSDTAGARRPGKIGKAYKKGEPVEKYSNLRAIAEIEKSDIVLLVLDASEKLTAQDLHIAGLVKERAKGVIIVANKWDLVANITQEDYLKMLTKNFNFMIWVPVIFVSAKTGKNINRILEVIENVYKNRNREIATSHLNRILEDFTLSNLPKGTGTYKPKVFFISQSGKNPPEFTITSKYPQAIHFSWRRAFENELRRHFDFTGTPIRINLKQK